MSIRKERSKANKAAYALARKLLRLDPPKAPITLAAANTDAPWMSHADMSRSRELARRCVGVFGGRTIPGRPLQQQRHAAEPGQPGQQQTAADE